MLKSLELVGFKSFAEKTRFEFPFGITAIVGPNGSGKSNIVDAVRWILGEQSARNLRGGEMADVIFNGSSSRRSLGMAEVTMTFDNQNRLLNFDTDEVQITRRVYRDGTGEYLINQQMSRLKDIKQLFLGSGAGTAAYCIIEQGRVDALLQASTADRRIIFEEAAGISRFKAKKMETLRKLEHVEENLTRLRDIMAEVEKQLRKLRLEAEKARKVQEYSERMKELRIGLGLREFHQLTQRLTQESHQLEELRSGLSDSQLQVSMWEEEANQLEQELQTTEQQINDSSARLAEARRQIATGTAAFQHEMSKSTEYEDEANRSRSRRMELAQHLRLMEDSVLSAIQEVDEVEDQAQEQQQRVQQLHHGITSLEELLNQLQTQIQEGRTRQMDLVRQVGTLQTQAESAKNQLERMNRDREQRRRKIDQKQSEIDSLEHILDALTQTDADLQQQLAQRREALAERIHDRDMLKRLAEVLQQELGELQVKRSELRGRIDILENLERSQEGLGTGVREMMRLLEAEQTNTAVATRSRREPSSLSSLIIGLVADHLSVPRDLAPLIDLALGETAQRFIVRDMMGLDRLFTRRNQSFTGRVSFLPLQNLDPLNEGDETNTADRWVTCEHPELAGLPRQLLGHVRIVEDLATARILFTEPECRGCRFVTRQGELLEPDGTLTIGPHHGESGILSRKSELRDVRQQAALLEKEIQQIERRLVDLRERIESQEVPIQTLEQEIALLTGQAGDVQTQILQRRQHRTHTEEEITLFRSELTLLEQELQSLEESWQITQTQAEEAEQVAQELKIHLEETERTIRLQEQNRLIQQQEHTTAQIALAQTEERLTALRNRQQQLETDLRRGREESQRVERHESVLMNRWLESQLAMLYSSSALAEAYSQKENQERFLQQATEKREQDRQRRRFLQDQLQSVRSSSKQQLESVHARDLIVRDLSNHQNMLIDRLRDDYQIDLQAEYQKLQTTPESEAPSEVYTLSTWDTEAVHREIQSLRDKIRRIGAVSFESINELTEVETRANELQTQHDDLTSSQKSLLEIIDKINIDSRKLFTETYEQIRIHFQELFRKLFGGGMADIQLDDPSDVLESGIEIMARPPGKELRSISLMSGGEKTLTAVALLLAIFRSKPSPFCLLDEVDAALDEANTNRLASVLREFTDHSQFIIITHKKRTMAVADLLHGVTMQESGVSKQISIRFEDWPEDEPIAQAA